MGIGEQLALVGLVATSPLWVPVSLIRDEIRWAGKKRSEVEYEARRYKIALATSVALSPIMVPVMLLTDIFDD